MFESIVGQENAKKALRLMIESKMIPHTLLFAGPYGVGKGETAFELARMLLCENGLDSGCNTCGSCVRASRLEHPDMHVLFPYRRKPDKAEAYGKWVDGLIEHSRLLAGESYAPVVYNKGVQVTQALVADVYERLYESSFEGGRRVCVILSAERLNEKTANSLLKILEEPPDGVNFILTAERISSVLPTIVSRASIVRFRRIRDDEIERYLEQAGVADPAVRLHIARIGDGSLKTAKALAFSDTGVVRSRARDLFLKAARGMGVESLATQFAWSRDLVEIEELIHGFARFAAGILESKVGFEELAGEDGLEYGRLARSTDIGAIGRLSAGLERGLDMLGRNVNASLVMTSVLYEIHDAFG
ncbi:MAG: hypothetical protein J7M24_03995 [Candidatus Latescibacteria bacterium]|nr:hypothetical protein [Candidatus Latescibacterota bacterium]